ARGPRRPGPGDRRPAVARVPEVRPGAQLQHLDVPGRVERGDRPPAQPVAARPPRRGAAGRGPARTRRRQRRRPREATATAPAAGLHRPPAAAGPRAAAALPRRAAAARDRRDPRHRRKQRLHQDRTPETAPPRRTLSARPDTWTPSWNSTTSNPPGRRWTRGW